MEKYKIFNDKQINLLEALAENYNILVITDRFGTFKPEVYVAADYKWPDTRSPYLSFNGFKKITKIIDDNSIYSNNPNSLKTIVTQIDTGTPVVNRWREFSSSQFSWVKF